MHEGSQRAIIAAFLANFGIAVAKFVAYGFTGAASMLAEAVHSVADAGNQGLLFLGGQRARRAASETHPFGYGRERYFWAFVVALVLFTLGALFAIYEGIEKLAHPHELAAPYWAIGVLILAIALEAGSFRIAIVEARGLKGAASWWQFIRRAKVPELPVVLLEDLGALLGLCFALLGIALALTTGNPSSDSLGSIAIGLLLGAIAISLAIETKSLLIGESASPDDVARIRAALAGAPSVRRVIHMRTLHIGPDELLIAAKLDFEPGLAFPELSAAIDEAESRVRRTTQVSCTIFIEPDVYRGSPG